MYESMGGGACHFEYVVVVDYLGHFHVFQGGTMEPETAISCRLSRLFDAHKSIHRWGIIV